MVILGIDPGIARCGWGVIRQEAGSVSAVDYGCLTTPAAARVEVRLASLYESVLEVIKKYHPAVVVVEELFFNTNAKTAFVVGQARGIILLAAAKQNAALATYTPLQVKLAVAGYGRAEKRQIQQMVKTMLKLSVIPKPDDTTDALAIALTHAFSRKFREQM